MAISKEIILKKGIGELSFGSTIDYTVHELGQPNHIEELEGLDDGNSMAYVYDDLHMITFFEGMDSKQLSIIESKDKEICLFGKQIFNMDEIEVHQLMKNNGFEEIDTEILTWGGKRVSFEDANIDFYFEDDKLNAVTWGAGL